MSVLIKHMTMPKGCIYANDKDQTEYCPLLNHDDVPFCQYIENEPEIAIGIDERPVYCPLSDVPEPCEDTVSRQAAIDAIEEVDWYHQNKNKDMVHGANSQEHQAWYKAEDIYQALDRLPSVQTEKANEQIKKAVIDAIKNADVVVAWDDEADDYDVVDIAIRATKSSVIKSIEDLLSVQPDDDMIHLQKEQAYLQGWEEGREALRKEMWEDGRDRLD